MKSKLHAFAGTIALICISLFWTSTMYSELFGTYAEIAKVKSNILWGMVILIPSMMAVGGSGFALGGKWKSKIISAKKIRMKIIAANGMVILLPSAIFLTQWADAGLFDAWFYTVQALEIIAGATNITLLGLNMKDGIALARRRASKKSP